MRNNEYIIRNGIKYKKIPYYKEYYISKCGKGFSLKTERPVACFHSHNGYVCMSLYQDKKTLNKRVARLVLLAWDRMPKEKEHAAHLDGDKLNNHITNLKWCSAKENAKHKTLHGTMATEERHGRAKLTREDVIYIRKNYVKFATGKSNIMELANKFNVSWKNIISIVQGKLWPNVYVSPSDKVKGQPVRGAKLTSNEVYFIRENYFKTSKQKSNAAYLSKKFNISKSTVFNIVNFISWRHLPIRKDPSHE